MPSKFMKIGVATVMAAGALVVTGGPASAIPSGTHGWRTAKSLSGVTANGTFRPSRWKGEPTALVRYNITDTNAHDGRLAAIQLKFYDADGNWESYYAWNTRNRRGTATGGQHSYYRYALSIRECRGTQYRKNGKLKFRASKCGGWRTYYRGTRILG
ncbi:hypothetical protein [Actinocorallia longicatena]|uniref:Secreted protein n=1 Tax=Actinocorallia longicatena TaxID=111803 RepID=A0ABP6QJV5_9ACTN